MRFTTKLRNRARAAPAVPVRPKSEVPSRLWGSRRRRLATIAVTLLALISTAVIVDEQRRPGLFYRYVVAQVPRVDHFYTSDADIVTLRLRMVDAADELLALDGFESVAWPDIQLFDDGTDARETPIGTLEVRVDPSTEISTLANRAREVSSRRSDSNLEIRITIRNGENTMRVRPTAMK